MVSTAPSKIPADSIDAAGLSVATASLNPDYPRRGTVYIASLADSIPVWFHPLNTGRYLMVMSGYQKRTTSKIRPTVTVGEPTWAVVHPSTGAQDSLTPIPSRLATQTRNLTAAVSRGEYLYILSESGGRALVQHFRSTVAGNMQLLAEEWVPGDLSLGLYIEKNYLWVFGAHASNYLTVARRNWARIGTKTNMNDQMNWLFRTERGWSSEVSEMAKLDGDLPCDGPVSVASLGGKYYMLATSHRDTTLPDSWTSSAYISRYTVDNGWERYPDHDIVVSSTSELYLAPARLQPQLSLSPGYTSVATSNGLTVLDSDSATSQVFTGTSGHTVSLPSKLSELKSFTLHNQSTADVAIVSSTGAKVGTLLRNTATTVTPNGRHKLFTFSGTATPDLTMFQALMGVKVDPAIWEWTPVIYPHWFPVQASVQRGVRNCIDAINAWPGKFGLSGYSQGAIVCSGVLWELRYGSLQNRYKDLIGAVMFGNPLREAGITFPGGIDPGGAGMGADTGLATGRIRDTPNDIWWEFANNNYEDPINGLHKIPGSIAGDPFAVTPTTEAGQYITAIYQVMMNEFSGDENNDLLPRLQALLTGKAPKEIQKVVQSIVHMFKGFGVGHVEYATSRPLSGSSLTSVELGVQHLNKVGAASPLQPQITSQLLARPSTWTESTPEVRNPSPRSGFPYVSTRLVTGGTAVDSTTSWLTSWGAFTV